MEVEVSSPTSAVSVVQLWSPNVTGQQCLSFWYVHDGELFVDELQVRTTNFLNMPKLPRWREAGEEERCGASDILLAFEIIIAFS